MIFGARVTKMLVVRCLSRLSWDQQLHWKDGAEDEDVADVGEWAGVEAETEFSHAVETEV